MICDKGGVCNDTRSCTICTAEYCVDVKWRWIVNLKSTVESYVVAAFGGNLREKCHECMAEIIGKL